MPSGSPARAQGSVGAGGVFTKRGARSSSGQVKSIRQSLYLKYRPQLFSELVGQEVVARTLRHAVRERHLSHAYLFTGVRGTGKTSAARILARAINCLQPEDGEPCQRCSACQVIGEGRSLDVIEIDAATNRGIDEIRDLRERAQFLPSELGTKVYIIDEAHMLTNEAGNAFLKTLEEPPAHACFILATTEPQRLSETILSRCQRFDFRRIPAAAMSAHLMEICRQEQVQTTSTVMDLVAEAGAGSLRDAESLLDRLLGLGEGILDLAVVRSALGMADPEAVTSLAEALWRRDAAAAWVRLRDLEGYGVDPRQLLRALGAHARARYWEELEGRGSPAAWLSLMEACADGGQQLRRADDPWMSLEVILLRQAASSPEPAALATTPTPSTPTAAPRPPAVPSPSASVTPSPPSPPRPASTPNPPAPPPPELRPAPPGPAVDPEWRAAWERVVEWARQHHVPFHALVRDTAPVGLRDGTLVIEVRYEWHLGQLSSPANRELMQQALREVTGEPLAVTLVLAGAAPAPPDGGGGRGGGGLAAALKHFPGSTVRKVDFLDPR